MWTAFGMLFLIAGCAAVDSEGDCENGACTSDDSIDTEAASASLNLLQVGLSVDGQQKATAKEMQAAFDVGQKEMEDQELEDQKLEANQTLLALADEADTKSGGDRRRCCAHRRRRRWCWYVNPTTLKTWTCPPDTAGCVYAGVANKVSMWSTVSNPYSAEAMAARSLCALWPSGCKKANLVDSCR